MKRSTNETPVTKSSSLLFRSTGKNLGIQLPKPTPTITSSVTNSLNKNSPYEAPPFNIPYNSSQRKISPLKFSRSGISDMSKTATVNYKPSFFLSESKSTNNYETGIYTSRKDSSSDISHLPTQRAKTPSTSSFKPSSSNYFPTEPSSFLSQRPSYNPSLFETRPQMSSLASTRSSSLFSSSTTAESPTIRTTQTVPRPSVGYINNSLTSSTSNRIFSGEYLTPSDKVSMSPRPINSQVKISALEKSSSLGIIPKATTDIEPSKSYLESAPKFNSNIDISLVGLQNIGNTCYMNSVLQCLSNILELRNYFLNEEYNQDLSSSKGAFAVEFANLIKKLWSKSSIILSKNNSFAPSEFKRAVEKYCSKFTGYSQEDAQEFLRYLLDNLHECLNRVKVKPTFVELKDIDKEEDYQKSERWFKNYIERNNSKITDLFSGQLKSTLECSRCRNKSICFDPFMDLNLPVPKNGSISSIALGTSASLDQCLNLYFQKEELQDDDAPYCSQCKCQQRCTKHLSLFRVPKILVLHLKRFSNNGLTKINTEVEFPIFQQLDLQPWIDKQSKVTNCKYELISIVNHNGTLYGGHYFATARSPLVKSQWITYNDSEVTVTSSAHIANYRAAYLLFYKLIE